MRPLVATSFAVMLLAGTAFTRAEDIPEFPKPTKEHEWLQQLVGEWTSEVSTIMAPDQPPVQSKGTESVRSVGGFWTIAENKGDFMGTPFLGVMTLGYDTESKKYVGTWTDSMSGYLWKYEGTVDKSGKVLTLNAEGPCPMTPGTTSKFKEVLEIKSPDHKVFSSSIQGEDGKWTKMMEIHYHRKR